MDINTTRNNYITNLTSTYHGVKCRRLATLHQKGLKVTIKSKSLHKSTFSCANLFPANFRFPFSGEFKQNIQTKWFVCSIAVFQSFWFANGQEIPYIIFINYKISVEVMFCVIFLNALVLRRFGASFFPICAPLFTIRVPLVPICVTLSDPPHFKIFL